MGYFYDGTDWRDSTTNDNLAATGWHHVSYVVDDTNDIQKVYIDGVEEASGSTEMEILHMILMALSTMSVYITVL
jgi:hypothetical protein